MTSAIRSGSGAGTKVLGLVWLQLLFLCKSSEPTTGVCHGISCTAGKEDVMLQMSKRTASAGCNPAKVARRRNAGQMCTCRRRSGASSTGEYACVGDSIVPTPTPTAPENCTVIPTPASPVPTPATTAASGSCCGKCGDEGYCSSQSGNCYASKSKNYYEQCGEPVEPTDCCDKCSGKAYCSPGSGNCYWNKAKDYYKVCDASAVPPGALPKANSSENAIKFMSYNLMGWNAFNQNKWRGDNVLAKIKDWEPAVLGAQEVEKGGYGYDEVSDTVTVATALEHVGGSQFYNADVIEKHESSWVNLVKGYWMSMTRFTHKKSGVQFLFFDSHWKHGYGMEQAEIIANAISEKRKKHGNPPTVLVGDTNQFCKAYETSAIKYLKGESGSSPVTFQDVHSDDYGKSFSDNNNPDCRVDFMLASTGQWALVRSFIDREGMGANGKASDHAPLMGELVPIA